MNNTYAYQKEFVDRAIDLLDSKGKAAVVLPTGVGKSYIAADVIRHYLREDECVIWCINHLIICETQKEKFIASSYKDVVPYISPLTYTSAGKYKGKRPFLIVIDEFQYVGAVKWRQNIQKLLDMFPDVPVLGLSATPFRPSDRIKKGEIYVARNMGDEFFEGNIDLVNNLTYFNKLKEETEACKGLSSGKCSNDVLPADFSIIDETVSYLDVLDNFNRKLDILKGNVVPEEKINMIVDAHLNKHAPMDFCLKQLNMSEADFVKIVEQYKEEERVS